ncbi:putative two-component response regulator and GGDEF family protein YeaJ [Vibrio chagasii]|nr:putative two-component response regulator and GGDEF family protein YeaJ [Vibrio chagasii]CAH7042265.1 putative two-component response regulator and GGDEF family protein YeaJ [Vibrio chagasii]
MKSYFRFKYVIVFSLSIYLISLFVNINSEMEKTTKKRNQIYSFIELHKDVSIFLSQRVEDNLENDGDFIKEYPYIFNSGRTSVENDINAAAIVMNDLQEYNPNLSKDKRILISYRSYKSKSFVFSRSVNSFHLDDSLFDKELCGPTRKCTIGVNEERLTDRLLISDIYSDVITGGLIFSIISPVYENEELIGDVIVDIYLEGGILNDYIIETTASNDNNTVFLIDKFGYFLGLGKDFLIDDIKLKIDNSNVLFINHSMAKVIFDSMLIFFFVLFLMESLRFLCLKILEKKEKINMVVKEAMKDELTGLYNRKVFETKAFLNSIKTNDYSLILLDGKEFKKINDMYGHKAGDRALSHISNSIRTTFRKCDWLVRIGGDEFVVILPSCSEIGAHKLANRLREAVNASPIKGYSLKVQVTTGISVASSEDTLEDVIERADHDMYRYKVL